MLRFALTVSVAILLGLAPAAAQQTGPIRLAPLPPAEPGPEPAVTPEPDEDADPGSVQIRGLEAVDEDAVGVLGDADGGLGQDMWSGTARADAVRLVRNMPDKFPFSAARRLAGRLLLTTATPPADGVDRGRLLAERVDRLVGIGAPEDALSLAATVSSRLVPEHLAEPVVRAHFLLGETARGCDVVDQFTGGYAAPFWQRALIICQIANGKGAEATLGLDLLREEGVASGAVFQDVAHAAAVGAEISPQQLDRPGTPDVLMYTLLRVAGAELPSWMLETDDPGLVRAIMGAEELDAQRRLELAHRALRVGLVDGVEVAAVYRGLEVADEDLAAALLDPESVDPELWPAYLYLAAARQTLPNARSEALWEAWTLAVASEVDDIVMATTAPLLKIVPATTDFAWLAAVGARAALLAGEDELAISWYQLVLRQARSVPDMARSATLMWPGMRVIGRTVPALEPDEPAEPEPVTVSAATPAAPAAPAVETRLTRALAEAPTIAVTPRAPVPWNEARLARWIDLAGAGGAAGGIGEALFLLQALGDPVTEAHWRAAPPADAGRGAGMPGVAILAGLERATDGGRRAEAVLYALAALGQAGDVPHPSVVGAVAGTLQRVGLDTEAQEIVREALVARGR